MARTISAGRPISSISAPIAPTASMVRCRPNSRSTWPFTPLGAIDQDIEQLEPRLILFVSLAGHAVDDEAALQHDRRGEHARPPHQLAETWGSRLARGSALYSYL